MKTYRPYLKLLLLLGIPLGMLMLYAVSPEYIQYGNYRLEKINLSVLTEGNEPAGNVDTVVNKGNHQKDEKRIQKDTIESEVQLDTMPRRIMLLGDSMVEGLSRRLSDYIAPSGHELTSICWYSSSTELWAQSDTISYFVNRYKPEYVLICIGGNEQFVRDLDKREQYIDKILKSLGDIPVVWICPPAWKKDTGINNLILRKVGEKKFFDSRTLTFRRGSDKVHPTFSSSAEWMDAIVLWLQSSRTEHPLRFKKPIAGSRRHCKQILIAPR